ncbi:MAG: hypothetical protein PHW69_06725 [Elusimicrobiaceae bacterium]|nr:hypothetical protein [Elusimicrobiaceae bacterium]
MKKLIYLALMAMMFPCLAAAAEAELAASAPKELSVFFKQTAHFAVPGASAGLEADVTKANMKKLVQNNNLQVIKHGARLYAISVTSGETPETVIETLKRSNIVMSACVRTRTSYRRLITVVFKKTVTVETDNGLSFKAQVNDDEKAGLLAKYGLCITDAYNAETFAAVVPQGQTGADIATQLANEPLVSRASAQQ